MKRIILLLGIVLSATPYIWSQLRGIVKGQGGPIAIAVPDFRGAADAQQFMTTFNATLSDDLQGSGQVKLIPKTSYPLNPPQQPSDFRPTGPGTQGRSLTDWAAPPVSANYLAFGYTAAQNNQIVLYGWLFDVNQASTTSAQLLAKVYVGTLNEAGARKVAEDFACDIAKQFGGGCLTGSRIYFVSNRSGHKEIWSMNYDGSDQKQFTDYRSITSFPVVSPDATKIAFTTYPLLPSSRAAADAPRSAIQQSRENLGTPQIYVHSLETGRKLVYYNQRASMNAASDFMPDSRHLLIYSTAGGGYSQIYMTDLDGGGLRRITQTNALEVEPKVNPKTGSMIVFVSGRGGNAQIYKMNIDGTDVARLTTGEGDAANPSWSPDGARIAFAWTRGFEPGNYNIFIMDVATREIVAQLTHGAGKNENPVWAPDGVHLVFSSTRGRSTQIYTMRADGNDVRQLTTQGNNEKPVWTNGTQ